ncbi:hypothetical protein SGL43_00830 [Streptomyces globisporus]|uniref:Uncharacterized protein n=1 Tax=Streptomyces globisporus TaxID=1908 RepID=A0ABN8UY57_STRGL|nr:hypothetical protein SGL43_00830 [Streptomyces globisporus]
MGTGANAVGGVPGRQQHTSGRDGSVAALRMNVPTPTGKSQVTAS